MNLVEQLEVIATQDLWQRPERLQALIIEGLRSPDEAALVLGARLAGEDLTPELTAEVEPLLENPSEEVRAQAIATLGLGFEGMRILEGWDGPEFSGLPMTRSQFHRVQRKLQGIYRDSEAPETIRRRALEALARAPEAWHLEAIRSAWSSDDLSWRVTAVRCMGHFDEFEAEILEALRSESLDLKEAGLWALFDNPLEAAGEEVVRMVATDGLQRSPRQPASPGICRVLRGPDHRGSGWRRAR